MSQGIKNASFNLRALRDIYPLDAPQLPPIHEDLVYTARLWDISLEKLVYTCLTNRGITHLQLRSNKIASRDKVDVLSGRVFGHALKGPYTCDVMIVGKCLSQEDHKNQLVYSGLTSNILINGFNAAGISSEVYSKFYVTNVINSLPLSKQKTTISGLWIDQQAHLLWQNILMIRPKLIILQGSEAVKLILGKQTTIASTEHKVFKVPINFSESADGPQDIQDVSVVCTLHPQAIAFALNKAGNTKQTHLRAREMTSEEKRFISQLRFVNSVIQNNYQQPKPKQVAIGAAEDIAKVGYRHTSHDLVYYVVDTAQQLEHHLKEMREYALANRGAVAWDAEWQGRRPQDNGAYLRCVQFAYKPRHAVVIALTEPGGKPRFKYTDELQTGDVEWTNEKVCREAGALCKKYMQGLRAAGHFFNADLAWLSYYGPDLTEEHKAADTAEEARTKGGLAIELAAHAIDETAKFGLDEQLVMHTAVPPYYVDFGNSKKKLIKEFGNKFAKDIAIYNRARAYLNKSKVKPPTGKKAKEKLIELTNKLAQLKKAAEYAQLEKDELKNGYGWIPDDVLYPYAAWDAAGEYDLMIYYFFGSDKVRPALDADRFNNDCWLPYWISHRAASPVLEINTTGLLVDRKKVDELGAIYTKRRDELLAELRYIFNWPNFEPHNRFHFAEALFGEKFNGYEVQYGSRRRFRPKGAKSLRLQPLRTSGKYPIEWETLKADQLNTYTPSTGKAVLNEMFYMGEKLTARVKNEEGEYVVKNVSYKNTLRKLIDYRYLFKLLTSLLRSPLKDEQGHIRTNPDGTFIYDAGITELISPDGYCRTSITQTAETGRWKSRDPNLQNVGGKLREVDFKRILGNSYKYPLRSIFTSEPGWFLVEADYSGAELMMAAVLSGDEIMLDHCRRANLPESHPDNFDIHANVAVRAFNLDCDPNKKGLESIGKAHLRNAAKIISFGTLYGQSPKTCAVGLRQQGTFIDTDEAVTIQNTLFGTYPGLRPMLEASANRAVDTVGYLCNLFGRWRRFSAYNSPAELLKMQREAKNAPIQGGVADAVSIAIYNVFAYRNRMRMRFKICLQVHDAILLYVPADELLQVVNEDNGVFKTCMVDEVPLRRRDLDGNILNEDDIYHFGYEYDIYKNWGLKPTPEHFLNYGLDPKIVGWKTEDNLKYFHKAYPDKYWQEEQFFNVS